MSATFAAFLFENVAQMAPWYLNLVCALMQVLLFIVLSKFFDQDNKGYERVVLEPPSDMWYGVNGDAMHDKDFIDHSYNMDLWSTVPVNKQTCDMWI